MDSGAAVIHKYNGTQSSIESKSDTMGCVSTVGEMEGATETKEKGPVTSTSRHEPAC